jgi:hypothetical protein
MVIVYTALSHTYIHTYIHLGFELKDLSHTCSLFCSGYFGDGVS